jgi:HEAT repeat protein
MCNVDKLIESLSDKNAAWDVREQAAIALGKLGSEAKKAVRALIKALQDDSEWVVRTQAALALRQIGAEANAALPALATTSTNDPNMLVREHAAVALSTIRALKIRALEDEDQFVRSIAER